MVFIIIQEDKRLSYLTELSSISSDSMKSYKNTKYYLLNGKKTALTINFIHLFLDLRTKNFLYDNFFMHKWNHRE